jgi:hypothetical protein
MRATVGGDVCGGGCVRPKECVTGGVPKMWIFSPGCYPLCAILSRGERKEGEGSLEDKLGLRYKQHVVRLLYHTSEHSTGRPS